MLGGNQWTSALVKVAPNPPPSAPGTPGDIPDPIHGFGGPNGRRIRSLAAGLSFSTYVCPARSRLGLSFPELSHFFLADCAENPGIDCSREGGPAPRSSGSKSKKKSMLFDEKVIFYSRRQSGIPCLERKSLTMLDPLAWRSSVDTSRVSQCNGRAANPPTRRGSRSWRRLSARRFFVAVVRSCRRQRTTAGRKCADPRFAHTSLETCMACYPRIAAVLLS